MKTINLNVFGFVSKIYEQNVAMKKNPVREYQ
jgi:hypothetical protein